MTRRRTVSVEALREYRDRLAGKAGDLDEMAERTRSRDEKKRLGGKSDGVALAVAFIDELLRDPR